MKKVVSLICTCALVISMLSAMLSMPATAQADAVVVYTISTCETDGIKAGETFEIEVSTNAIEKICMAEFFFAYDATKIKAISATTEGFLNEFMMKNANVAPVAPKLGDPNVGEVWLTGMALADSDAAEGEVISTVTFKALVDINEDVAMYCFQEPLAAKAPVEALLTCSYVDGGVKYKSKPARPVVTIVSESATAAYASENQNASAKVTAEGDGLTYTWHIKNPGATKYSQSSVKTATYSAKMTSASSGRLAYCIVKDQYGNQVRSKTFVLRMKATITSEPATAAYAKKGATASVKIGAAGDGLTYTWYIKNANGTKYSKSSITSATYKATMSDTVKDRRVYCVVKDKYGKTVQSKTFLLREAASITTQPKSTTVAKGATAKVTVKASGDGLTYTWYIKNAGATKYSKSSITKATYSVKMSNTTKNRLVYCVVKDKYGKTVQTNTVQLKMK